jgi:hypothetical protein
MNSPVVSTTVQGAGKSTSIRAGSISAFYQFVNLDVGTLDMFRCLEIAAYCSALRGRLRGILTRGHPRRVRPACCGGIAASDREFK